MKPITLAPTTILCSALSLSLAPAAVAQEVMGEWVSSEDEYEAHFGEGPGASQPQGPQDLQEALEQGRGYRLGGGGRYSSDAPKSSADGTHRVVEGETLWDISKRYYGDPMQWPRLWSFNPEITNPHWIYADSNVRLSSDAGEGGQQGQGAGTGDSAPGRPQMSRAQRPSRQTGSVFLRDQGFLGPEGMKSIGTLTGSRNERVMLTSSDEVYVQFREGAEVRPGQTLSIFRRAQPIEREPGAKGMLVRVYGTLVVRSYDPEQRLARAVITETLVPVERGSSVAKVDRPFLSVSPVRNDANVVAHVVSSLDPHMLLSEQNVVFLDVGAKQGVKVGNRFFIVRKGDPYLDDVRGPAHHTGVMPLPKYKRGKFPKEVVAELRVVRVLENSSVTLITRSDVDLEVGDLAEMRVGF